MATKKPKSAQRLSKNQRELKILAKAGLYKGDWRKAKSTASGRQLALRKKFAGELEGLQSGALKAVKVPRGTKLSSDMKRTGERVVVTAGKGERIRYSKKTGDFSSIVYRDGIKFRRIILPTDPESVGKLLHRKGLYYQVPFKQSGIKSPLFEDPEELAKFMADYEKKRFKDWLNYVEILELIDKSEADEVETYDA